MAKLKKRDIRLRLGSSTISGFRIVYNIYFGFEDSPRTSTVQVFNKSVDEFIPLPRFAPIQIFSGFFEGGALPSLAFEGILIDIEEEVYVDYTVAKFSIDRISLKNRSQQIINLTIDENPRTIKSVIQTILSDLGVQIENANLLPQDQLVNYTFNGSPLNLLNELLNPYDLTWAETGNTLLFYVPSERTSGVKQVNRDTGLILSPDRKDLGTYSFQEEARYINVKTRLNHSFILGESIQLKSITYNGVCRINNIHHIADNWAGTYETNLVCRI